MIQVTSESEGTLASEDTPMSYMCQKREGVGSNVVLLKVVKQQLKAWTDTNSQIMIST